MNALFACVALAVASFEPPPGVRAALAEPELSGACRLSFLWIEGYDAYLWREADAGADLYAAPFALRLEYLRDFSTEQLATATLRELSRQQGFVEEEGMYDRFAQLWPAVAAGDAITAVWRPENGVVFRHNGEPYSELADPGLGRRVLDIWLGEETSVPQLRDVLVGE
ncbi:MAG: chalcone isomerase family protein [Betaproteobacteria bacterium AqS2]|uniref:Chalcone isomerase family protein n=1 Tax=Candidatus Amphirhobacter heronislandensis TaxID=1732024 RepID=A0A930UFB7_9GAMM|nr:chalcone isomerase family protein [Betaproteobacteria bacterium AqS2]